MDNTSPLKFYVLSAHLKKQIILFVYGCISFLFFFVIRDVENSQDYLNYLDWFEDIIQTNQHVDFLQLKDPAFNFLSEVSHMFGGGVFSVVLSLVSIAIISKIMFLIRFDTRIILAFIPLYFCKLFFIFELTQFRAAASISTATLAFFLFIDNKYFKSILCLLVALAIHMSALLIILGIPLFFLVSKVKNQEKLVSIFLLIIFFSIIFPFDFSLLTNIPVVGSRITPYINGEYKAENLSLINFYLLIKLSFLFFYAVWFCFKKVKGIKDNRDFYLHLFFYMSCLSTILFLVFRQNDAIALRLSEFFSVFDLLFFSFLVVVFNKESKVIFRLMLFFLCCVFLFSSIKLLNY